MANPVYVIDDFNIGPRDFNKIDKAQELIEKFKGPDYKSRQKEYNTVYLFTPELNYEKHFGTLQKMVFDILQRPMDYHMNVKKGWIKFRKFIRENDNKIEYIIKEFARYFEKNRPNQNQKITIQRLRYVTNTLLKNIDYVGITGFRNIILTPLRLVFDFEEKERIILSSLEDLYKKRTVTVKDFRIFIGLVFRQYIIPGTLKLLHQEKILITQLCRLYQNSVSFESNHVTTIEGALGLNKHYRDLHMFLQAIHKGHIPVEIEEHLEEFSRTMVFLMKNLKYVSKNTSKI